MGTHDLFMRAHELAGEFNIARGNYHQDDQGQGCMPWQASAHCTVGFIYRAADELMLGEDVRAEAILAAHHAAGLKHNTCGGGLTYWNDVIAADEDVRALFRKLAGVPEQTPQTEGQEVLALA